MVRVTFYRTADGFEPVRAYLDSLSVKMRAKVLGHIELLAERGADLRMPFSRHLEDGIFELRVSQGGNIVRVLYFFVVGGEAVLTHGFTKKTQKTPRREIERAKSAREDWRSRHD